MITNKGCHDLKRKINQNASRYKNEKSSECSQTN